MNTVLLCILSLAIAIPFAESTAYCTYHMYTAGDSLTSVACSDGANGIMTKFGYSNLSPMYPYVTAYSGASWNSPQCGRCVRVSSGGRQIHLTVIDYCGPPPGGNDAHFDIAPEAFEELFGASGKNAGVQYADWTFVDTYNCRGNKGNSGGNPPPPPPVWNPPPPTWNPPPPASSSSSVRCGSSWGDANGKCGTPCVDNDGPCGGEKCFRDLSTAPCGRATEDDVTSFASEENVVIEESFNNDNFDDTFAAVADVAEEFVDNYVDNAVADASFENFDSNFDAAVVGEEAASVNTQQQPQQQVATGMQGWMVAILVMFSITTVLLLAVIVLGVFVMRKH